MIALIQQAWPWYFSGLLIFLIMLTLIFWGKSFGFSANLQTLCTLAGAGKKVKFFDIDWKAQRWNLLFLLGSMLGGFIASTFLQSPEPLQLSAATIADLKSLGFSFNGGLNPDELYANKVFTEPKTIMILLTGGLLVGFGARYAGGCTSGHAISGLSNLQLPSLLAVIGFFTGGLIMTHFIFPLIF